MCHQSQVSPLTADKNSYSIIVIRSVILSYWVLLLQKKYFLIKWRTFNCLCVKHLKHFIFILYLLPDNPHTFYFNNKENIMNSNKSREVQWKWYIQSPDKIRIITNKIITKNRKNSITKRLHRNVRTVMTYWMIWPRGSGLCRAHLWCFSDRWSFRTPRLPGACWRCPERRRMFRPVWCWRSARRISPDTSLVPS